ncbi:MAG: LytTR family transcriptional regulator DNA-binding domain-containing protein [Bacteroidia bacterium]
MQLFLDNGKTVLTRSTIAEMQGRIPEAIFCRISRSCIINVHCVTAVEKKQVLLKEHMLDISATFRDALIVKLERL